ncbi:MULTISPECIES: MCE family protein [unclassified Mycobacterium]|uniref:MCE family protein n=1 Tax=unclassified Mycobacterium TaxID=2642494 RepID=UPI0029C7391D|nr:MULTISPECIES: MCE family protein [unclassified Mycobacterium]
MTANMGPGPIHRSETASAATPIGAEPGANFGARGYVRPLAGLGTVIVLGLIIALAVGLFAGRFTESVPVTVLSPRAGLVMDPDAKVKLHGVEVGRVASIEMRPDGQASIRLAMDPSQLPIIPANTVVDIASTTIFGSKFIRLVPPEDPSPQRMHAGQILDAKHVTVEINTVFQQLTSVLGSLQPEKLNATLSALQQGFNGRGQQFGQTLSDFNAFLAKIEPGLPALSHDLDVAPQVFNAYADAAPDLLKTMDNATRVSQTIVDEQQNLDAFLVSAIGLADIGNDVIGGNRQALTDVLHLLVPTTELLNEYHENLNCGLAGMVPLYSAAPFPNPGAMVSISFTLGLERYRYPANLPKVAAKGPPTCGSQLLPKVPNETNPPFVVADIGANPAQYGNQGILLNSDALKQMLFGPIDGPPRNSAQIGQPG